MKNVLAILILGLAVITSQAFAEPMSDAERNAVRAAALELVESTPKRIDSEAIQQTFTAKFYDVELKIAQGPGSWQNVTLRLARSGDAYQSVGLPSTDAKMPELAKLMHPRFRLSDQDQAQVLQTALDEIYPVSTFGSEKPPREIRQSGTTWEFIRGKFFKDYKGFVVTTTEEGMITGIAYSLSIKAQ
jgi:hypothetical protein